MLDREGLVHEEWHARQRRRIAALIDDDLIEEHRRDPLGPHSDRLARVLTYFRGAPPAGKYVVVATRPWREYRIGVLSGVRGERPRILEEETFATEEQAMHGVFLQRVRDLLGS